MQLLTDLLQPILHPSDAEIALIALLLFGLLSYAYSRGRAYYLDRMHGVPDEQSEEFYMRLPVAWPTIFIIWSCAALAIIWAYPAIPTPWAIPFQQAVLADEGKQLFLIYLVGFASMWITYLLSSSDNSLLKSRSLRRLLMAYSQNWQKKIPPRPGQTLAEIAEEEISREKEVIEARQRKANSSITWIALLVAAAAVMLGLINDVALQEIDKAGVWEKAMLAAAAASAIIAFYCFVVAADALETVFNDFSGVHPDLQIRLVDRLYGYALNPKYYGLICLISSVALFAAARYPLFGALALATATFIGYGHWFPRLRTRHGVERLEWILRIGIVVIPILMLQPHAV